MVESIKDSEKIGADDISLRDAETWVEALRSGKYKQTKGEMHNVKGFCPLGVALIQFTPVLDLKLRRGNYIDGVVPSDQEKAPAWIKVVDSRFYRKTGLSLSELNDGTAKDLETLEPLGIMSFEEIADCVEAAFVLKAVENED